MLRFLFLRPQWIVVAFGFFALWLTQTDWLTESPAWQKTQGSMVDHRYSNRHSRKADPAIKLIGLGTSSFQLDALKPDEIAASPTLQLMQQPWPWDRRVYAAILEKLMAAGAKVVLFDFVFASETEGDDELARALEKYKDHVVIGEMFANEKGSDSETTKLTLPNPRLLRPGTESVVGLVNIWTDADDVVRRGKYFTSKEREDGLTAFPDNLTHITVAALEKFRGQILTPPTNSPNYIDFAGPAGTYRPLPVENLFVDKLWNSADFKGGLIFSNKIVVVGPTAEIFHDVHVTPFGEMPGPEIQAQMTAALLHGSWLTETSPRFNRLLAVAAVLVALIICLWIPQAPLKVILLVGTTVAFFAVCQLDFSTSKLVIPMLRPVFCFLATGTFGIVFLYSLEEIERRRYRKLFGRYVSKNVAKMILDDRRSLADSLLGVKKPVTILFSDIRGFTTMTEKTDAAQLVAQLNEYFAEMVDIIQQKNGGTLQKFIGDAIMAAWGDTHSLGNAEDARRAVAAALEMRRGLVRLNERWRHKPDRQQLATGIGVNHGEVVYGNIGSKDRTELTVLGDGVNLAARLESATKQFHTDILIGEEAEKLTRDHFVFRQVDLLTLKGKTKPVEVFSLVSERSVPAPGWLAQYHQAISLYRRQKFQDAIGLFESVQVQIGRKDYLCEMYLGRCSLFSDNPPPDDWDGSFTLADK